MEKTYRPASGYIFLVLSVAFLAASVYGFVNQWYTLYPAVLAAMAALGIGLFLYFRRRKWL